MFDKINKEKEKYEKNIIIGGVITALAFILFLPLVASLGPSGFIIIVIPFFGGAIYMGQNSRKIKLISSKFKGKFVEEELKKVFPDSIYKQYDGFTEKEVVESGLLFNRDRFYSEDMISGNFESVNFRCSDVKQQEVRKTKNSTRVVTVFQGRFYEFDFHKPFKHDLLLLQPMNFRPFSDFHKVNTENINFNSELKVYARNELEAFYILTPDFMEKVRELDDKYLDKISFAFKNNKLYIAVDTRKDYFDFKAFKKVDESLISSYKEEFEDIKAFIFTLNLNSTLFK
jgi:hypothetical protein